MSPNQRTITVEGMHCGGCQARVKDALEDVPGVTEATVLLEQAQARITLKDDVAEATLRDAVEDAGFEAPSS